MNKKESTFPGVLGSEPPLDWLREQLRVRSLESAFLREEVFPNPVRRWKPAEFAPHASTTSAVVKVAIFGIEPRTSAMYVTQPFRLIGQHLFAGLKPDALCMELGLEMALSLCISPEVEIETNSLLTGTGEFQLIVALEADLVNLWSSGSKAWATNPDSIPFGLVLRPLDKPSDGPSQFARIEVSRDMSLLSCNR